MKKLLLSLLFPLCLLAGYAHASQTWIVIGDSILSATNQGTAKQLALHLVSNEKDVIFRNISSPGSSLGHTDKTGFNNAATTATINQIGGAWGFYGGVLIQAGTNDFGRSVPWADTVTSLRKILDKVKVDGKKAIVLAPIWRANEDVPNAVGNVLTTYRYFMYVVCEQEYGDICHYASQANTVMGTSAGSAYYDSTEVANGTQLHPNVTGHRKLADWIKAEAAAAGYF